MSSRHLGWAVGWWVALMGLLFAVPPVVADIDGGQSAVSRLLMELQDASRYVYVIVLTICMVSAALVAARKLGSDRGSNGKIKGSGS